MNATVRMNCAIFVWIFNIVCSQMIYHSLSILSNPGNRYIPKNIPGQFIEWFFVDSWRACAHECNKNVLCRIFDYGSMQTNQCLLFQGDAETLGNIVPSDMPESIVGTLQISSSLFTEYDQPCVSICKETRYLICSASQTCTCTSNMYWNPTVLMCLPQMTYEGAPCDPNLNMCREDLGFHCLIPNVCSSSNNSDPDTTPTSISNVIADSSTIIEGSSWNGLEYPFGLAYYKTDDIESLIVVEGSKNEIILISNIHSVNKTASVLVRNWTNDDSLIAPDYLFLDTNNQNNLYVVDAGGSRVLLFTAMQFISPLPKQVAGDITNSGDYLSRLDSPGGVAVDSQQNVYVADTYNHRIMLWQPDAEMGIQITGTGTEGSGPTELNYPTGVFLDDSNALLYVVDSNNHRIQLYNLTGSPPLSGTTVAGGNDNGNGNNQLDQPSDVWVSKKNGAIYIADTSNHRIQCWMPGATEGTTIVPVGQVSSPLGLVLNQNETRVYVSSAGTTRVQWFDID